MADWRIWKYPLPMRHESELLLPQGFRFLHVGLQGEQIYAWIMHDVDQVKKFSVRFIVYGTGHPVTHDIRRLWHMATVQVGAFVWHVFMEVEPLQETRRIV